MRKAEPTTYRALLRFALHATTHRADHPQASQPIHRNLVAEKWSLVAATRLIQWNLVAKQIVVFQIAFE